MFYLDLRIFPVAIKHKSVKVRKSKIGYFILMDIILWKYTDYINCGNGVLMVWYAKCVK